MTKKEYQKPTMNVVNVQMSQMLCNSPVTGVTTNLDDGDGLNIGGPGSGDGRGPGFGIGGGLLDDWDE